MIGRGRSIGLVVGLGGAALLGYTLFGLFTSGSCMRTGPGEMACGGPGAWAVAGGIILNVIGMLLGGGIILFSALFVAIGLAALVPTWLGMMPGMEMFGWLFGGIFLVCGLLPFLVGIVGGRMLANKQVMAAELMTSGRKGIGTIVEVRDTGSTVNDNPRVVIRMRIAPLDNGAPVERSKTVTVSRVAVPRVGERYPAWFSSNDPEKWMFATDMDETAPAEIRDLFARARAAGKAADHGSDDGEDSPVEELARLSVLWNDGALTDAEFADAKARLLPRIGR
jgi:hypothetical protein